ncbi:hypothetical protein L6164_023639 [Bauhinia variegata]|uniref:Uncharacterized protein n=2 Tax=Bauhinia variegata TaxID=167791 RepID=A0ACB9MJQ1_BAUVA|nr:hypothetical protein L6164_023639 [Bauhinia variegata]
MGKNIVFLESPENPGKRSRLWSITDINNILAKNKGTKAIQGIVLYFPRGFETNETRALDLLRAYETDERRALDLLQGYETGERRALDLPQGYEACLHPDAFSKASQVKLLKLCKMQLPHGLNCLPSALKVLDWTECPLKSLPLTIELDELINLKLRRSKLETLWNGTKFLGSLKSIDMSFSMNVTGIPDISGVPNLEKLVLEGCEGLLKVHPSLGLHRSLVLVSFKDCKNLKYLPSKLEMSSMEDLILSGCSKVKQLPEFGESMEHLSSLTLSGTSIEELPLSLGCLIGLDVLNLQDCKNLCCLPSTIQNLKSLRILNISGCSRLSRLPENLKEIKSLMEVNASGTAIAEVPSCILDLEHLQKLSFEGCKRLESKTWINWLLELWSIPQVPMDFSFRLPRSFSTLPMLRILNLSYCNLSEGSIPGDIECLYFLERLDLSGNNFISLPNSISELSMLKFLHINCCKRLQSLPELPSKLEVLDARNSTSLKTFKSNFSKQCSLVPWSKNWIFNENYNTRDSYSTLNFWKRKSIYFPVGRVDLSYRLLVEDDMLQERLLAQKFHITIPGDKIPSWFDTQNSSSLATLRLQFPHNCSLTQWVGIAFSCVLVYKGYSYFRRSYHGYNICYDMDGVQFELPAVGSVGPRGEPNQPHLSIIYMSAIKLRERIYKNNDCREIEFRFDTRGLNVSSKIFGRGDRECLEVIGCGGRLVYDQDFEDWNKTIWAMQQ